MHQNKRQGQGLIWLEILVRFVRQHSLWQPEVAILQFYDEWHEVAFLELRLLMSNVCLNSKQNE